MRDLLESLDSIAEQDLEEKRVTFNTLAKLSGIENPDKIYPGQKITLPGGGSYTVKRGDTLSGIAQDYRLGNIGKKDDFKGMDDPNKGKTPKGPDPLNIMNPSDEVRAKAADSPKKGGPDPLGIFSPKKKAEPKDTPRDGGNPGGTTKAVDQTANVKSKYDAIASTAGKTAADVYAKNVRLDPRATQDTKDALPKYNKVDIPKKAQGPDPLGLAGPKGKTWGEPGHGFTISPGTSTTTKGNTVGMSEPTTQQRAQSLYQQIKGMIDAKPSTSGQMKRANTSGDKK